MTDTIEGRCEARGLRMTEQRRVIAQVLEQATDHPDVEELYARASAREDRERPPARRRENGDGDRRDDQLDDDQLRTLTSCASNVGSV